MSQASPQFGASCTDIHGDSVRGGEFFTPINDVCQHCKCLDGYAVSCMTFSCAKPKCSNYKRVPGKCCEYTCPDGLGLSSAAQLGIILSLSIALIVVIIIIVIMWRRSRKQKSSPKRSRNQQTSLETECNIPNNQRHLNPCSQAVIMEPMSRQTTTASSLPPYTPKKYDPEAIASCEPPPPYTPEATTLV